MLRMIVLPLSTWNGDGTNAANMQLESRPRQSLVEEQDGVGSAGFVEDRVEVRRSLKLALPALGPQFEAQQSREPFGGTNHIGS